MKSHLYPSQPPRAQRGIALVFVLLMVVIAITAALFAARSTLLGDKAARNDRDRQIAFQAAEMALNDAELDIMDADLALASGSNARGCKFGNAKAAFVVEPGCSADSARRGVCGVNAAIMASPSVPFYKQVNWEDTNDTTRAYALFGEFTGRSAQLSTGDGSTTVAPPKPSKPPKYIIVQAPNKPQILLGAGRTFQVEGAYKIYAIGYGVSPDTKVMLEGEIYKPTIEKTCG